MRNSYKRKFREDSDYGVVKSKRYTRGGEREYLERRTYLRDEDDGYHFHIDLNLNKDIIGRVGKVAKRLFGGILDYVDTPDDYDDRERFVDRRDRRSKGSYPERDRRR